MFPFQIISHLQCLWQKRTFPNVRYSAESFGCVADLASCALEVVQSVSCEQGQKILG